MAWGAHLVLATDGADLLHGLDDADLVVDEHRGHHDGVGADGGAQRVEVDEALGVDRQVGDVEALLLQHAAGVEDALVLRLCRDDVLLGVLVEVGDALEGEVVGLGRTRGENDLPRLSSCTLSASVARSWSCMGGGGLARTTARLLGCVGGSLDSVHGQRMREVSCGPRTAHC